MRNGNVHSRGNQERKCELGQNSERPTAAIDGEETKGADDRSRYEENEEKSSVSTAAGTGLRHRTGKGSV